MSRPDKLDGIFLGEKTRWVIDGLSDFEPFFRHFGQLVPEEDVLLYFEGGSMSPDVRAFMEKHAVPAQHKICRGTISPEPLIFHLAASIKVLSGLANLASQHAYPEIADHCHVYNKEGMILQWYDACDPDCPLGAGPTIPEERVKKFCELTGATYKAYKSG